MERRGDEPRGRDPVSDGDAELVDEPRNVLESSGTIVKEPERSGTNSFCCGAGGAMLFTEETEGTRINRERTDELLRTGADKVAVACPFCSMMVRDALKDKGKQEEVAVKDVAQFAADRLQT